MTGPLCPIVVPHGRHVLAGGWCRFSDLRDVTSGAVVPAEEISPTILHRFTAARSPVAGLHFDSPQIMGILNVTPDSFSDGGKFHGADAAIAQAQAMVAAGANILDIGGESTRPGADYVEIEEEIARTAPIIEALKPQVSVPISIDTRKAPVGQAALNAGATLLNDVAAFSFDPAMADLAVKTQTAACLMHSQGLPKTMQDNPTYGDVVVEVLDALEDRVTFAESKGMHRSQIIVDPGIGFGKTLDHNIMLLKNLAAFHSLGCPILLGASRKRFIGTLTGVDAADERVAGSVAVALQAVSQGAQIVRVHDVAETRQALTMQMALWV